MTAAPKLLLDLQELADTLGVHRSQVYRMLTRGELPLPILHIGRSPRVRTADVEVWLERLAEEAEAEVNNGRQKQTPATKMASPAGVASIQPARRGVST